MYATIALLPLLAFVATITASPTPLRSVARAVPDLKAVIRNPTPIDGRKDINEILELLGLEALDLPSHSSRATTAIDNIAADPIDVVGRAVPALHHIAHNPVEIRP
ncbi:hypothetical protein EJ02DRAFT_393372 [Clathrospora elynae]|uniref:Uncharacterized protein n=1 Tax=Clathrospora elynae TaxID=706981 RepID=A0A6A5T2Q9_9PLEO|nr:hypothetical protein EJ02DRAFT_393372 [Clathrospora elynae]